MIWQLSHRADPLAKELADRHYNRQKPDTPQFVPPGRCIVLYHADETMKAFWVTSAPYSEYVKHRWAGAWVCSAFRKEGEGKASDMIKAAVAASRWLLGSVPPLGMVTFIDKKYVKPVKVRNVKTWGYTWLQAGFKPEGKTKGGLLAFRLAVEDMPPESPPGIPVGLEVVYEKTMYRRFLRDYKLSR